MADQSEKRQSNGIRAFMERLQLMEHCWRIWMDSVGAIVDGELNKKGDPSRGARYNFIENYINWV